MPDAVHLKLPNGRGIDFKIRRSGRAKSIWLRVTPRDGLVVTVPPGVTRPEVLRLVAGKSDWVARHLDALEAARLSGSSAVKRRPSRLEFLALGESWNIDYRETQSASLAARTEGQGRVSISGAIGQVEDCHAALRRWLMRYAKDRLGGLLDEVARETRLHYSALTVRNQRSRWGSCTHDGRISLNAKLLFLPPEQVRYVMVHELCHTLEHNHSARFWSAVRRFEPDLDRLHADMRGAWKLIPDWAYHG
ncbi:M48 family metallopeptidase [Thiorhodococcus mannitoliphagus]|uniref:M48 family metallopeptidase n=1 Tax=Thiorhodococcus mannitoliphagus TaxID=329406 RepID=A0A6P1DV10_9GAMM|nr:SprT family zinc-dependent metalloprotease [Thiorhodococcus mannitoliphagus]NEX21579.1 M48 family metallopeptidase [Thiorhodococcus mannitoliphagus]